MKLVEIYPEKQGRPASEVSLDMERRGPSIPTGYISGIMLQASYSVVKQTNNYTAAGYALILVDAGSPVTVTLPEAGANTGRYYIIKKVDGSGNNVTIKPNSSSELIDGEQSLTLRLQYQYVTICCSGVEVGNSYWHIIGGMNMKLEEIIDRLGNEQVSLLSQLLDELRQNKLHLASMSDEPVESGDGDAS